MEDDFKKFIINSAKNLNPRDAVEDTYFTSRLLRDVLYGRSKRKNKSSRYMEKSNEAGGLEFLRREFELSKKEKTMPLQICPRDGGSLMNMRGADGSEYLRCPTCGAEYASIPPKGANPLDYMRKEKED